MGVLKERCPNCGGTIIIPDNSSMGECDSCGSMFSLSELQTIKEAILYSQSRIKENDGGFGEEAALDPNGAEDISFAALCAKTEMALEAEQWHVATSFCNEIIRRNPKFAKAYLYRIMIDRKVFKKEELANLEKPFDNNENYRLLMRFGDEYLKSEIVRCNETIKRKCQERALEKRYQELCDILQKAYRCRHYQKLAEAFRNLGDYKDSAALSEECLSNYKIARKKARKKAAILSITLTLAICMCIFAIAGAIMIVSSLRKASYRAELFTAEVTDKVNIDYDDDTVSCLFEFNVTNESRHDVSYLEGILTIRDAEGNVLARYKTWFRGTIASDSTKYLDVTLDLDMGPSAVHIWNSDFSDLEITYQITQIRFDNGKIKDYSAD